MSNNQAAVSAFSTVILNTTLSPAIKFAHGVNIVFHHAHGDGGIGGGLLTDHHSSSALSSAAS